MSNNDLAISFRDLAYLDYIAARLLLNNNYPLQGLTLASTAIEKYLKVILCSRGVERRKMSVHLDRLDTLQKLLAEKYVDVTANMDKRFLDLLGKAYKSRYYDNLTQPMMIGFFVKQFLCELDHAVNILEKLIKATDVNGNSISSPYWRAAASQDSDLIENNFIFQKIDKKEFMEQPDNGFGVYIDPANGYQTIELSSKPIRNSYDGRITDINVNFAPAP